VSSAPIPEEDREKKTFHDLTGKFGGGGKYIHSEWGTKKEKCSGGRRFIKFSGSKTPKWQSIWLPDTQKGKRGARAFTLNKRKKWKSHLRRVFPKRSNGLFVGKVKKGSGGRWGKSGTGLWSAGTGKGI